jgi:CubicO group peptidase (beta-lactamase class C family)
MNSAPRICLSVICLTGVAPGLPGQQRQLPDAARAQIDILLAPFDLVSTPGCAVGIAQDGQLIFAHGYGMSDLAAGTRLSPTSVLGLASYSKQFTAAAIALLEQQGRLSTDDDIRRWLPEMPSYGSPIRIRDLLHHTSGIRDYLSMAGLAGHDAEGLLPPDVSMGLIIRQRGLNHPTGERSSYSNSNYFLLAQIVERATGMQFATFLADHIFKPLGMHHTRFASAGDAVGGQAESYREAEDGRLMQVTLTSMLSGDGGAYGTVADLAKWEANFWNPTLGTDPAALVQTMRTEGRFADGRAIGYGWGTQFSTYRGARTEGHGGTWGGYRSMVLRFPAQRMAAIVLCNRLEISPFQVTRRLADIVIGDSLAASTEAPGSLRTPGNPPTPTGTMMARVVLEQYTGRFQSTELEASYIFALDSTGLTLATPWSSPQRVIVTHADTLATSGRTLVIQRDSGGKVSGFTLNSGRVRGVEFQRIAPIPLRIPRGNAVIIDGVAGAGEWDSAHRLEIAVTPGHRIAVQVQHDGDALLVSFNGFRNTDSSLRVPEVLIDPRGDGGTSWGTDDWWFHASARDCASQGRFNDYTTCVGEGPTWSATNMRGAGVPPALMELRIPFALTGLAAGRCFRVAFNVTNTRPQWEFWPATARMESPSSWAEACLDR